MARKGKGRRRKFRPYLRGSFNNTMQLGTLGPKDLIRQVSGNVLTEKAWLSSIRSTWAMQDYTAAVNDGPILVGIAHSDYTDAEIEEFIENAGSWSAGNLVQQEVAKRKIRIVGIFRNPPLAEETAILNDGKPITTKCGWQLITGQTIQFWAYNTGSSALGTTDPAVESTGHANLWPN